MNEIETGGPAFPLKEPLSDDCLGMTLRDYFAAKILQSTIAGYLSHSDNANEKISPELMEVFAKEAYQMADAMLKARAK